MIRSVSHSRWKSWMRMLAGNLQPIDEIVTAVGRSVGRNHDIRRICGRGATVDGTRRSATGLYNTLKLGVDK